MVRSLVCPSVPVRVRLSVSQPSSNDGIFISIIIFICMSCLINAGEKKNLVPFYIIRKSLYIFVFAKTANGRRIRRERAEKGGGGGSGGRSRRKAMESLAME